MAILLLRLLDTSATGDDARPLPPPIGPHVGLTNQDFPGSRSFGGDERVVMTHYFYWYDVESGAHLVNPDGGDALTTHPASLDDFSYRSIDWHTRQLRDMRAAGIDVVLPVFWGAPSDHQPGAPMFWSFEGLRVLVQAAEQMERAGESPPRIGMFYDTSTLRHNAWNEHIDLTTRRGRAWLYATIRDFFSLVPPRFWAMIDGRPIVVLYSAAFAKAHDQRCVDEVYTRFAEDFGGRRPYIVREVSWNVRTESLYAWGGAIAPNVLGMAELGPGYDHSSVPGRAPLVVPRDGGQHYEDAWQAVLRRAPRLVTIETWNEFHEGTDIAESREYGRQYIELTRLYVDRFKQGWTPPWPTGPFTDAPAVEVVLGPENLGHGLEQVDHADGVTAPAVAVGVACRAVEPTAHRGRYIYFRIVDSFKWAAAMDVTIEVEYFDDGRGRFGLEYDSHDLAATHNGAYRAHPEPVSLQDRQTWRTARFAVTGARFTGAQNGGTDFRLVVEAPSLRVRRVAVVREGASGNGR